MSCLTLRTVRQSRAGPLEAVNRLSQDASVSLRLCVCCFSPPRECEEGVWGERYRVWRWQSLQTSSDVSQTLTSSQTTQAGEKRSRACVCVCVEYIYCNTALSQWQQWSVDNCNLFVEIMINYSSTKWYSLSVQSQLCKCVYNSCTKKISFY